MGFDGNNEFEMGTISMFDEEGNGAEFHVLSMKRVEDCLYMIAETDADDDSDPEVSEVLIFKCTEEIDFNSVEMPEDDVIFELIDEEHEGYDKALSLFTDDFKALGIEF